MVLRRDERVMQTLQAPLAVVKQSAFKLPIFTFWFSVDSRLRKHAR